MCTLMLSFVTYLKTMQIQDSVQRWSSIHALLTHFLPICDFDLSFLHCAEVYATQTAEGKINHIKILGEGKSGALLLYRQVRGNRIWGMNRIIFLADIT